MKRFSLGLVLSILIATTHQSPAPIVEEEKPTPAPSGAPSEAPKREHHSGKSTSPEQSQTQDKARSKPAPAPASQGPARFSGTWSGKVNQGLLGHVPTTLTVDANTTSIELSQNLGGGSKPLTISGNTISWKSGVAGEITWTLRPNNDGQTAQVTMKGLMLNDTATFRRGPIAAHSDAQR